MTRSFYFAVFSSAFAFGLGTLSPVAATRSACAEDSIQVRFDCAPAIMCREVISDDVNVVHHDEKIVEATFKISTRIAKGDVRDLKEVLFEINSPNRRLRVYDFSPVTELTSDIAEPIRIIKTVDHQKSLGASLGSTVVAPGPIDAKVTPSANLGTSKHTGIREEQRKLPAKRPVVVSGTAHFGHGLFFKFKPSSQTSLEGVRELTCRFVVPQAWRGDWLLLSCRATGDRTKYLIRTRGRCGDARYVVGLYLEGEDDAKDAAEQLAATQVGPQAVTPELSAASEVLSAFSGVDAVTCYSSRGRQ